MQDDPTEEMQNKQIKENNAVRKKAMEKERSRRFREKKRLNVLKSVHHVVHSFRFCRVILNTHSCFVLPSLFRVPNHLPFALIPCAILEGI